MWRRSDVNDGLQSEQQQQQQQIQSGRGKQSVLVSLCDIVALADEVTASLQEANHLLPAPARAPESCVASIVMALFSSARAATCLVFLALLQFFTRSLFLRQVAGVHLERL